MTPEKYISDQEKVEEKLLALLHDIILSEDKSVTASVGEMMSKKMIIYKDGEMFKYGLAKVKKHLTLHLLPMYCSAAVFEKYKKLLSDATFQKGCINFTDQQQMPAATVAKLIKDCSKVDMSAIQNKLQQTKKVKG